MGGARAQALEEKTAWLWMAAALGPGAPNSGMALSMFPDARALAQACWKEDLSMVFTPAQLAALRAARPEDYTARLDDCARHGVNVLTWADEDYPDLLRAVSAPPPVLYYRGDAGIPNRCFTFAIVGTRRPSAYGVEATASIAGELARAGVALVSGLATGLDSESHKAAVQAGAPTVACIAFGHDQCYPAANRTLKGVIERQGLVLSEYPPGTPPQRGYFLQRNRLIAGLSRGLCVAEARRRSGTMNTVAAALAAGRDVFSVPGSIFRRCARARTSPARGRGARCIGRGYPLWYGLAQPEQPEKAKPDGAPLSLDAQRMRDAMSAAAPLPLDALCAKTACRRPRRWRL
ncbi:MAG: DNA-processing protein DprA [Ruthenibacterium lactatiformans]